MRCADQGNGTYVNPVLLCDYSDPDAIRVGDTYYLTASSFNFVPGLPILTSQDLVNWTLRNYALKNIPEEAYAVPQHAKGVWAPAIRYHDGMFYIFYGMPDEGIFMVRAADPLGEWEQPVCVRPGKGFIDPCPFWNEDGSAWIIHAYAKSRIGFKSVLGMFPISADGTHATGEDHIFYDGHKTQPTIEGPKVYKRDGWYYIFAPAGGVATGWQTVLRARSLQGPWEEKVVLKQGSGVVNGPHQGAWVDTPEGEDWFLHFQSRGLYGRIVHLQPMGWQEDGWPWMGAPDEHPERAPLVIGEPGPEGESAARAAMAAPCGIPVSMHRKPGARETQPHVDDMSDPFDGRLGLQWQFMGTWSPAFYEVGQGSLTLRACHLPGAGRTLWACPQVLSQKIAALSFTATVALDAGGLAVGERAGLVLLGGQYAALALERTEAGWQLCLIESEDAPEGKREHVRVLRPMAARAELRVTLRQTGYAEGAADLAFLGEDGAWQTVLHGYVPDRHTWVGVRVGLFAMPVDGGAHGGQAVFGGFRVDGE